MGNIKAYKESRTEYEVYGILGDNKLKWVAVNHIFNKSIFSAQHKVIAATAIKFYIDKDCKFKIQ